MRFANAAISYAKYIGKTLWPERLSVIYPYPAHISLSAAFLCAFLLISVTVVSYRLRGRLPWLFVGWFWFVGTLVPVIGIVQVGNQAMADRYVYIPHIGLFIAIVWTIAGLSIPVAARATA